MPDAATSVSPAGTGRFPLVVRGPEASEWDISIRKGRLVLTLRPTGWRHDRPLPDFVVTGPGGAVLEHRARPIGTTGRMSLAVPCAQVLDEATEIALELILGPRRLHETVPIRCATAEDFQRHLQFADDRRMSDGRKFSREIIAGLALRSSQSPGLEPHYRVAAAVVHIYKAIELPERIALPPAEYVAEFEALAHQLIDQHGDIRTDGIQLYLSILTVGWHRALAAGDITAMTRALTRIAALARRLTPPDGDLRARLRTSYVKNIGSSLLLLAYIQRISGRAARARDTVSDLYAFHIATTGLLGRLAEGRRRVAVDPSEFKGTLECGHTTYLALCIDADIRGKNRTVIRQNLELAGILDAVLRVKAQAFRDSAILHLTEYAEERADPDQAAEG